MLIYLIQYYIYSLCINFFTLFTLILHLYDHVSHRVLLEQYDYIIVGSGTAGSLIAHRIAVETDYSYVVLEAGGAGSFLLDIPVFGPLLQGSVFDWQHETVPQEHACQSLKDKKSKWPRGKIIGGSGRLNNMIHVRGNLSHYVDWFDGKYDIEYFTQQFEFIEHHILQVEHLQYQSELGEAVLKAAVELGYKIIKPDSPFEKGFMKSPLNQKHGARWATSHTFLANSHNVFTNHIVNKLLIDAHENTYGVQYSFRGKVSNLLSRKGVILCAGSIDTPKILLQSGIGPMEHLKAVKIPLVKDLPVGKNLQDHITTGVDLVIVNNSLNYNALDLVNPFNILKYFMQGNGPLTSPGCEAVGFLSTLKGDNITQSPDIQFMVLPVGIAADRGNHLKSTIGIQDNEWNNYFAKSFHAQAVSILPILLHPKSIGEIKLHSNHFDHRPMIDPKYLSCEEDVKKLVKGIKLVEEFVNTDAMKSLGAYINPLPFPGCEVFTIFSQAYWECYVRRLTLTSFHPVGTCKMGPPDSPTSVVDMDFKVLGINQLYIADGSVLPHLPSGNVNAAIALMANIFFETHFSKIKWFASERYCRKRDFFIELWLKICVSKHILTSDL